MCSREEKLMNYCGNYWNSNIYFDNRNYWSLVIFIVELMQITCRNDVCKMYGALYIHKRRAWPNE